MALYAGTIDTATQRRTRVLRAFHARAVITALVASAFVVMADPRATARSAMPQAATPRTLSVELTLVDKSGRAIPPRTPVHVTLRTLYDDVIATRGGYGAEHRFEGLPWHGNAAADVTVDVVSTDYHAESFKLPRQVRGTTQRARIVLRTRGNVLVPDNADAMRARHPHIAHAIERIPTSPHVGVDLVVLHPVSRANLLNLLALFELLQCGSRPFVEDVLGVVSDSVTIDRAILLVDRERAGCWSSTVVAKALPSDLTMSASRTPTGRAVTFKVRDVYASVAIDIDESQTVLVGSVAGHAATVEVTYGGNLGERSPFGLRGLLEGISTDWPVPFRPPDRRVATPAATLWEAAVIGDAAAVSALLRSGADPRKKVGDYPPIWSALAGRHTEAARLLWQAAPIADALLWAAEHDQVELLSIMLPDTRLPQRDPSLPFQALLRAVQRGRQASVEFLLRNGVDPSHPPEGWTRVNALADAIGRRRVSSVRLLLRAGMDPNADYDAEDVDEQGRTVVYHPLEHAAAVGDPEIVGALLDSGARVDEEEGIALRTAASRGHDLVVAELIRRGAEVDPILSPGVGGPALLLAATNGHEAAVRLLLAAGAKADHGDSTGWTPLYGAALHGYAEILTALLDAGADVNAKNALAAAVVDNAGNAVRVLLAHGADPNTIFDGMPLAEYAVSRGNTAALEALQRRRYSPTRAEALTYKGLRALLRESPLFLEAEALLPAGARADDEIQQRLQLVATGVLAEYKDQAQYIRDRFKVAGIDRIRLTVDDLGVATALARQDAEGYVIRIDYRLVRAALSAALELNLDDAFVVAPEAQLAALRHMRDRFRLLNAVDRAQITVSREPTSVSVSGPDVVNAAVLEAVTEFDRLRSRLERIESAYMGSLMFVVAHEIAHAALGHLGQDNSECAASQKAELDADQLAGMLLARTFIAVSTVAVDIDNRIRWYIDPGELREHTGHVAFFGPVLERAGQIPESCLYPTATERAAATEQVFQDVVAREGKDVVESMSRGLPRSAFLATALSGGTNNGLSAWIRRLLH